MRFKYLTHGWNMLIPVITLIILLFLNVTPNLPLFAAFLPANALDEKSFGDKMFRVGDKVMQIKNNYQMV